MEQFQKLRKQVLDYQVLVLKNQCTEQEMIQTENQIRNDATQILANHIKQQSYKELYSCDIIAPNNVFHANVQLITRIKTELAKYCVEFQTLQSLQNQQNNSNTTYSQAIQQQQASPQTQTQQQNQQQLSQLDGDINLKFQLLTTRTMQQQNQKQQLQLNIEALNKQVQEKQVETKEMEITINKQDYELVQFKAEVIQLLAQFQQLQQTVSKQQTKSNNNKNFINELKEVAIYLKSKVRLFDQFTIQQQVDVKQILNQLQKVSGKLVTDNHLNLSNTKIDHNQLKNDLQKYQQTLTDSAHQKQFVLSAQQQLSQTEKPNSKKQVKQNGFPKNRQPINKPVINNKLEENELDKLLSSQGKSNKVEKKPIQQQPQQKIISKSAFNAFKKDVVEENNQIIENNAQNDISKLDEYKNKQKVTIKDKQQQQQKEIQIFPDNSLLVDNMHDISDLNCSPIEKQNKQQYNQDELLEYRRIAHQRAQQAIKKEQQLVQQQITQKDILLKKRDERINVFKKHQQEKQQQGFQQVDRLVYQNDKVDVEEEEKNKQLNQRYINQQQAMLNLQFAKQQAKKSTVLQQEQQNNSQDKVNDISNACNLVQNNSEQQQQKFGENLDKILEEIDADFFG